MTKEGAIIILTNTASFLRDGTRYFKPEHEKQFREAYEMAIKALEELEQRWIPVSEKAHPDLPIRVQVQMNNGWIITAYYQDGEWLSVPDCEDAIHDEWIEAWRELPEPWKGEKHES